MDFEDGRDGWSSENDTSGDEQDFRTAPSSMSRQQVLTEYSQRFPGRLASRLLAKMAGMAGREEGAKITGRNRHVAQAYLQGVLMPTHREVLTTRNLREMRTLCQALDLMSDRRYGEAADLLAQRLKAVEKATIDGHWNGAQLLELVEPEGTTLLEKDESLALSREVAALRKISGTGWPMSKGQSKGWNAAHVPQGSTDFPPKGEGKGKGKKKGNAIHEKIEGGNPY
eukprot:6469154-Amphidinium_carterae.2